MVDSLGISPALIDIGVNGTFFLHLTLVGAEHVCGLQLRTSDLPLALCSDEFYPGIFYLFLSILLCLLITPSLLLSSASGLSFEMPLQSLADSCFLYERN